MKDFFIEHWDRVALMVLFVFLVLVEIHLVHHGDNSAREWGETLASQVLSALLGYSAGKVMNQQNGQNPPSGGIK